MKPAKKKRSKPTTRKLAVESGKRLSPEDRRAQILSVAEALFADRSFDAIGMLDVAKAAGITQGLVYHYFESKDALFRAAFEASTTELLRRSLPDPSLPVPLQFELGVKGYLDYVQARQVAYLNIFRGPLSGSPDFHAIVERTRNAFVDHIIDRLGLSGRAIPATRLSLRGYLGYIEYTILDWLERKPIPRAGLERLIFAMIITALRSGLELDKAVPLTATQLSDFEQTYKQHFGLP
jgi:AcrR family transcriptional regulator